MRLGGPVFHPAADPEQWAIGVRAAGFRAAYCPVTADADDHTVAAYAAAAAAHDVVIAEVGAWSNPLSPDAATRDAAMARCINDLALAERIGARCCVNISGSRGDVWDGPHPANLTPTTFDLIVDCVRAILAAVKPRRAFYTLETMPWMYPDSVESYDRLLTAIDHPQFGVHFDPVNLISCPSRYLTNGELIRDFVARLGPQIRSCHAKDITLATKLTVHLDECRPGTGRLDYATFLTAVAGLDPDTTVMLEHLGSAADYAAAADHLRAVAAAQGLSWE